MQPLKPVYTIYEWYLSINLKFENMTRHIAVMMDGKRQYSKIMEIEL